MSVVWFPCCDPRRTATWRTYSMPFLGCHDIRLYASKTGARSDNAGVYAEYYWLNIYYPRYQPTQQRLIARTDPRYPKLITRRKADGTLITIHTDDKSALPRHFDQIIIENWLRRSTQIYFDITEFAHGFDNKDDPKKYSGKPAENVTGGVKHLEYTDWRFPFNR